MAEADGSVDAIGLGGIDIYVYSPTTRYEMKDGARLRDVVKSTPVVDGSGLKNSLEKRVVSTLVESGPFPIAGEKVLMVCAVDRFGMAESLVDAGADVTFGDLIFALDMPVPIKSFEQLAKVADEILPRLTQGPFDALYPVGAEQEKEPEPRGEELFSESSLIAGDFHYIRRYMPLTLEGKAVLTNTTTPSDVEALRERGVKWLVTTTPRLGGRSFGTNVLEAVFVAALAKGLDQVNPDDYLDLLDRLEIEPSIEEL